MKKVFGRTYNKLATVLPMELLKAAFLPVILILIALGLAYKYVDPAPPRKIAISTGPQGSNYYAFATLYREYLKREGIVLELHESKGDIENLERLKDPHSGIDVAFVQDGAASTEGAGSLLSLGSLYYEPAWIFCRCKSKITHLSELRGKKIAVGIEGGGTHALAIKLLNASGINAENSSFSAIGDQSAVDAIEQGNIDAAIFVDVPDSPLIQKISQNPMIQLISLDDAEAFTRQFPYLHHLVLPEGSLDLKLNIPAQDVHLLAPTAALIVNDKLHSALVYLMLKVISKVHSGPAMLNKQRAFPSDMDADFPLSSQAENFYKSGLPFLDKYLPFWAATFISRVIVILVPLLALLIPLTKIIPTIYVWLVKMKLYRHYGELRFLETQIRLENDRGNCKKYLEKLNDIEKNVTELRLPIAFSQHIYELIGHIELVRTKLQRIAVD